MAIPESLLKHSDKKVFRNNNGYALNSYPAWIWINVQAQISPVLDKAYAAVVPPLVSSFSLVFLHCNRIRPCLASPGPLQCLMAGLLPCFQTEKDVLVLSVSTTCCCQAILWPWEFYWEAITIPLRKRWKFVGEKPYWIVQLIDYLLACPDINPQNLFCPWETKVFLL